MQVLKLGICSNLTDASISYLTAKLAPFLQTLEMVNCPKITDASVTALGNACSSLRYLMNDDKRDEFKK